MHGEILYIACTTPQDYEGLLKLNTIYIYTGLLKIMLTLMDYNDHLFPAKCVSRL